MQQWLPKNMVHIVLAMVFSSGASLLGAYGLKQLLSNYKQSYSDIIVGNITWTDYYKDMDYIIVWSSILLFCIFFLMISRILNGFNFTFNNHEFNLCAEPSRRVLIFIVFISSFVFVLSLMEGPYKASYLMGILVACLYAGFLSYYYENVNNRMNFFISILLQLTLVYFAVLGVLVLLYYWDSSLIASLKGMPVLAVIITGILNLLTLRAVKNPQAHLKFNILLLQIFIPMLLLVSITPVVMRGQDIERMVVSRTEYIVWGIVLLALVLQWIHFYKNRSSLESVAKIDSLISMPTILIIAFASLMQLPAASTLFYDDFHSGEIILPVHQLFEFHQSFNIDFISVQGLQGLFYGIINNLFLDGTVSTFGIVIVWAPAIISVVVAFLVAKIYGRIWALLYAVLFLAVVASSLSTRYFLVAPALLILTNPKIQHKHLSWLITWFWVSGVHCFYNPTIGAALTLATIPLAIYHIRKCIQNNSLTIIWKTKKLLTCSVLIVHILVLALIFPYILGTIDFLLANSSSNTIGYGIGLFEPNQGVPSWFPHWFETEKLNRLIWELVRIGGWVFTIFMFIASLLYTFMKKETPSIIRFYILSGILFLLISSPYALGRIDSGNMNRTGSITLLCFSFIIPLLIMLYMYYFKKIKFSHGILLGCLLGIGSLFVQNDYSSYASRLLQPLQVPQEFVKVSGVESGIPKLGNMFADKSRIDEIINFNDALKVLLKPTETFADLTNRSLLYFITDKKVPAPYSADYLAANEEIQNKIISKFEEENPPVVFIGPAIRHDGGPASLRSYRIYRWFMDHGYSYYKQNGLQFMLRSDRAKELNVVPSKQQNIGNLSAVFGSKELMSVPAAWGRGMEKMNRFNIVDDTLTISLLNELQLNASEWFISAGNDPYAVFKMATPLSGEQADYLEFNIEFENPGLYRGQIFWDVDGSFTEENSYVFNLSEGTMLIPLGAHPSWYLNDHINIRLDVDNLPNRSSFKVSGMRLVKLEK